MKKQYTGPYNIISVRSRGAYEINDGTKTFQVSGPHLKPYNDPSSIVDSVHLESPHKDSLECSHEDSAHTTSAHLESPFENSATAHLESSLEDSAHMPSHHDSAHLDFA